jgi:hypothetical protein
VVDGQPEPGRRAHRVAEDVGLLDPDRLHERRDVAREVRVGDRPVDIRGATVALELQRVDAVRLGQPPDDLAQAGDIHVFAMQHYHRIAAAGDLMVHPHAVDLDPIAFGRLLGESGAGCDERCRGQCNA